MNIPHLTSPRVFSTTHSIFTTAPGTGRKQLILPILQMVKEYRQTEFPFHPEAALAKP